MIVSSFYIIIQAYTKIYINDMYIYYRKRNKKYKLGHYKGMFDWQVHRVGKNSLMTSNTISIVLYIYIYIQCMSYLSYQWLMLLLRRKNVHCDILQLLYTKIIPFKRLMLQLKTRMDLNYIFHESFTETCK